MLRKTKIVCTLGPAVDDVETMKKLLTSGMNISRFNFSHGSHEEHRMRIEMVREASESVGIPVALLLDTKGPEIRTGIIKDGGTVTLNQNDTIILTTDTIEGDEKMISVSYQNLPYEVAKGGNIYVADGLINLEVTEVRDNRIHCVVRSGGQLGSRKNVNVPGVKTALPAITEKDEQDIRFGISMEMDFLAASFIRKPIDVQTIQSLVDSERGSMHIVSKIEDAEGLSNIAELTRLSAGIMVARGDLGVQLTTEQIPLAQKRIIQECNRQNKPVITATQMLDSMISNPKPTRAEVTDVANAIFDGTDAVMLSGETAGGKHPVEAVQMMHRIATEIEHSAEYIHRSKEYFFFHKSSNDIGEAIARAAYVVATDVEASAIVAPTLRGNSPRLLSKYRPVQPIIAVTTSPVVHRQLLLNWGIYPVLTGYVNDSEMMIQNSLSLALKKQYVKRNDKVVTAAGIPLNSPIMMNTVKVHYLGNILNRGQKGFGHICSGRLIKAQNYDEALLRLDSEGDQILLVPELDEKFYPLLKNLRGLIVEKRLPMPLEEIQAQNPDLVLIAEVRDAYRQFESKQSISIDGEEKIVYEGFLE